MRSKIKNILFTFFVCFFGFMTQHCTASKEKKDNFPPASDYVGYNLVDARHVQNISLDVEKGTKLAIVVRDLAVTAFTNLETPAYDKALIRFEGVDRCCLPKNGLIGASGLLVYKFQVLEISKKPSIIKLVARHKGLNMMAEHYDSDLVTQIELLTH